MRICELLSPHPRTDGKDGYQVATPTVPDEAGFRFLRVEVHDLEDQVVKTFLVDPTGIPFEDNLNLKNDSAYRDEILTTAGFAK